MPYKLAYWARAYCVAQLATLHAMLKLCGAGKSYQPLSNTRYAQARNVFLHFKKLLGAQATFQQHAP
jgi:hypothetical protein